MSLRARRPDRALRLLSVLLLVLLSGCAGRAPPLFIPPATIAIERPTGAGLSWLALGDSKVALQTRYGPCRRGGVLLLSLHEDEKTAAAAGLALLPVAGGRFVGLLHRGRRELDFTLGAAHYRIDPNRIFSPAGIKATLAHYGEDALSARQSVAAFADSVLSRAGFYQASAIIALHNNHPGGYSVASYLPGGPLSADALAVHLTEGQPADNFFYLTDARLFAPLAAQGFNVVLQDRNHVSDDGSLSVYAARHGVPYLNVEAGRGQLAAQTQMLRVALQLLQGMGLAGCAAVPY
jgi:hypothetical protein